MKKHIKHQLFLFSKIVLKNFKKNSSEVILFKVIIYNEFKLIFFNLRNQYDFFAYPEIF